MSAGASTVRTGMAEKKAVSVCLARAACMAGRQAVAVTMTRGRAFCRIQAISSLVRAGDTRVAVMPEARVPKKTGAKGRQLGSWISTIGAISGPAGHVGVGGSLTRSLGSSPRRNKPAATASASLEIWPKVRARSGTAGCQCEVSGE
jgi:hypothetical protein